MSAENKIYCVGMAFVACVGALNWVAGVVMALVLASVIFVRTRKGWTCIHRSKN